MRLFQFRASFLTSASTRLRELYSSILFQWLPLVRQVELRSDMEAPRYVNYVLTLLFKKYVFVKYAGNRYAIIVVLEGGSFDDMVALKVNNKKIGDLAKENDLKDVFDLADFNDDNKLGSGKEMQNRLSKLVAIFDNLPT